MPVFSLSRLRQARPTMRRRLFLYMGTLAVLLITVLVVSLLVLGQLKSPRAETKKTLTFQMEAFRTDMASLWRNVSVMGSHLSGDMTAILAEQAADISSLSGDADGIRALEDAMLEPLCQYVRQADCSGAFVLLNASMREGSGLRSGLYVQRSNAEHATAGELLLYRGLAGVGKAHGVMPHRKWAQEFDLAAFPGLAEHLDAASAPAERSCRTTGVITLPNTSEQTILLTVPMIGEDGTVYGLCGFSVNQTYFSAHHAQPSGFSSLACVLSGGGDELDISGSLLTYPVGGFCAVPDILLEEKSLRGGLTAFVGPDAAFVGLSESFRASDWDTEPHTLTVMIPKEDYDRLLLENGLRTGAMLVLLVFFGAVCCLFYARRYLRPILQDLDSLKEDSGGGQMTFDELMPISRKIQAHERTITDLEARRQDAQDRAERLLSEKEDLRERMETAKADAEKMAQKRKGEIDPEVYQLFLTAYQKLNADERVIINDMADGVSVQVMAERLGKKPSTVYSYRRDIYARVGILGPDKLRQLRVLVTLMRREQEEQGQSPSQENP